MTRLLVERSVKGTGMSTMPPCSGSVPILIVESVVPEGQATLGSTGKVGERVVGVLDHEDDDPRPGGKRDDQLYTTFLAHFDVVFQGILRNSERYCHLRVPISCLASQVLFNCITAVTILVYLGVHRTMPGGRREASTQE